MTSRDDGYLTLWNVLEWGQGGDACCKLGVFLVAPWLAEAKKGRAIADSALLGE
jgi:hypothetical protein